MTRLHHMIICPNRLLHCKILYIDHYRNIVPCFETKSLSLNALIWAKKKNKHTKFYKKITSHLATNITDQKEAWQQSHGLWEFVMLFFATPPLTINAIYDLSAHGHHHADSWQFLKGHSPTWEEQACCSPGDLCFPI